MMFGMLRSKGSMRRRKEDPGGTRAAAKRELDQQRERRDEFGLPQIPATAPTSLVWRPAAPVVPPSVPMTVAAADAPKSTKEAASPLPAAAPHPTEQMADAPLRERVIAALRTVFDPEIPVNIYDLGLVYDLDIDEKNNVAIRMTLTAPGCPVAADMPGWVESAVRGVDGVSDVSVELVWEPVWNPEMMSEAARLELGFI
jgi:FeS assembly SUF system protein